MLYAALLMLGLATGVVATIPLAWYWSKRTERRVRELEQQARTNERLAELGTMTSGLAHEIKNPLSTVGLNLQLLSEDIDELTGQLKDAGDAPPQSVEKLGRVSRRLDTLARENSRVRQILEDFLRFAGRVKLNKEPTPLNGLIDELVDFFTPQAQADGVQIRTQLDPEIKDVSLDPDLTKQAMLNLMVNAVQAMREARDKPGTEHGGATELMIRTAHLPPTKTNTDPRVGIHVTDTGPGIPDEHRDKILQPYFSTKRTGTGLGLPTTRRIIEEHGGTLTVHSEQGRGTEFVISLPG